MRCFQLHLSWVFLRNNVLAHYVQTLGNRPWSRQQYWFGEFQCGVASYVELDASAKKGRVRENILSGRVCNGFLLSQGSKSLLSL